MILKGFKKPSPIGFRAGFTLAEVVVALSIAGLSFAVVISGYLSSADQAEWSGYSLAAQSLALQAAEQARAARWDPMTWPAIDDLGGTNYTQVDRLDVTAAGIPIYATNYISITNVSTAPYIRQLRADCVWFIASRGPRTRGPFTNTAVTFRTVDQ
jgi:prepilin-type N-terminal cleavage/methylation domain-containing protein